MSAVALRSDFERAGLNSLTTWWGVPSLAEKAAQRFNTDPTYLVDAFRRGQVERARKYVEEQVADLGGDAVDAFDVRALIETAAQSADLPARELVSIVARAAPRACAEKRSRTLLTWAEMAIHDFQRVPAMRAANDDPFPSPPPTVDLIPPDEEAPAVATQEPPVDRLQDAEPWSPPSLANAAMWADPKLMRAGPRLAYSDFDPDEACPTPTWLAKGLLPKKGVGLLFGESGAGKSFAAIHMSLCIAWGLPAFGAKTKRGGVLYIAAEGGKGVKRRVAAASRAMAPAIAAANVCRSKGAPALHRAPIRIVHEAPDLSRDGSPTALVNTIYDAAYDFEQQGERLALVVLDTWHSCLGGGDENAASDTGHALKPLIAAAEEGDLLVLAVHHPGKSQESGARGSSSLPAACDAIISVKVPGHLGAVAKPSTATRLAVVTKMRDGEAGSEFAYRLPVVETGIDEDGDMTTTCVVEPCDAAKIFGTDPTTGLPKGAEDVLAAVTAAINESGGRGVLQEARLRFNAMNAEKKPDAKRNAWKRGLDKLRELKLVETDDSDLQVWLKVAPSDTAPAG